MDPEFFARVVLYEPVNPFVNERCVHVCVFARYLVVFFCFWIFGPEDTPSSRREKEKKYTQPSSTGRQGLAEYVCKIQHLCQKRREHSGFCAENILNSRSCPLLLSFSIGSTLGDRYALVLALRSQIFEHVRKRFVGVPWGT